MFYLEYEESTHLVVGIYETEPTTIKEGCLLATSDMYPPGLEIECVITVDTVNQEGMVTASSSTKQTAPAHQLLTKISELQIENANLKTETQSLQEKNTEIKLALAELAEMVAGGVA